MMGNPDWAKSELFKNRFARRQNWDALELMVEEWTNQHTLNEVSSLARERAVPCMPINTIKDLIEAEQLVAREAFVEVDHKEAGKIKYPGAPYKLSATPWRIEHPAPLLGEHNEDVYCEMLGYTKQDMVKMRQAGII